MSFARRLEEALAGSALSAPLPPAAAAFAERRGDDAAARRIDGPALRGLARVLVTEPQVAGFTSHRPAWLERVAELGPGSLAPRAASLADATEALLHEDLEPALDELRLCRREEMALAACADLGGLEAFEDVSEFLSVLAETILSRALLLARRETRGSESTPFSVLGMGKLAGRELTYHSDLDLIFLYEGGPEQIDPAARLGQRLISYLTMMTGAGVAYEVDTRLRPSGRQGMLVTSSASFERYQTQQAQTWEHLAVLRSRAVAGDPSAAALLARVHAWVVARHEAPWAELAPLRRRVETERGAEVAGRIALKTGPGGLMDVDFLAGGGLLERGARTLVERNVPTLPELPSIAALLRACARGPRVEATLAAYRSLRIAEARARWLAGRGIEVLDLSGATVTAELFEPGLDAAGLAARLDAARRTIRAAFDAVVKAGTLDALES